MQDAEGVKTKALGRMCTGRHPGLSKGPDRTDEKVETKASQ